MKCEQITEFQENGKSYFRTSYSEVLIGNLERVEDRLFIFRGGYLKEVNVRWYDTQKFVKKALNKTLRAILKRKSTIILGVLLIVALGGLNSSSITPEYWRLERYVEELKIRAGDQRYNNELSIESVRWWLERYEVLFPKVVLAQVLHETGWLNSRICSENNNLLGMKLARGRETTAIGELNGHAEYTDFKASIRDYKLWQEYHQEKIDQCRSDGDYRLFLRSARYAEDENYISLLILIGKRI